MAKFAKYHRAGHPAMRRMLVEGRQRALEKTLALLEARLSQATDEARRQHLARKLQGVKEQLARLHRLLGPDGEVG